MTTENLTFARWMQEVSRHCLALSGVSIHDLADQPFRDWYDDDELTPEEAAREALIDEGFPFEDE